jgi:hypothetical protein
MYSGFRHYDRASAKRAVTKVSDANAAWHAMEEHWILIEDLSKGTTAMRRKHRLSG